MDDQLSVTRPHLQPEEELRQLEMDALIFGLAQNSLDIGSPEGYRGVGARFVAQDSTTTPALIHKWGLNSSVGQ